MEGEHVSVLVRKPELVFMNVYGYNSFFFPMKGGSKIQQTLGLVCHVRT